MEDKFQRYLSRVIAKNHVRGYEWVRGKRSVRLKQDGNETGIGLTISTCYDVLKLPEEGDHGVIFSGVDGQGNRYVKRHSEPWKYYFAKEINESIKNWSQ